MYNQPNQGEQITKWCLELGRVPKRFGKSRSKPLSKHIQPKKLAKQMAGAIIIGKFIDRGIKLNSRTITLKESVLAVRDAILGA